MKMFDKRLIGIINIYYKFCGIMYYNTQASKNRSALVVGRYRGTLASLAWVTVLPNTPRFFHRRTLPIAASMLNR